MSINESTDQLIKTLTDNFLASIVQTVQDRALAALNQQIDQLDVEDLLKQVIDQSVMPTVTQSIQSHINANLEIQLAQANVVDLIGQQVLHTVVPRIETQLKDRVAAEITTRLSAIDVQALSYQHISTALKDIVSNLNFPAASIPGSAVNAQGLAITGDNMVGGLIRNFESTGIQDQATRCQVTILDDATVFENRLLPASLEVAGDAAIKGTLSIEGSVDPASAGIQDLIKLIAENFEQQYQNGTYDQYCNRVLSEIAVNGLDAASVMVKGQSLVTDDKLAGAITKSNLQHVGALRELQVVGETLLDQSLYVSAGRVGINTLEPERTLEVWDQEVQIVAGKKQQDTAVFGTLRAQNLVITANGRDQLTLGSDGSVNVRNINIGRTNHSSAVRMPTDNRPIGHIVWNENPIVGTSVGWISLGGARWAAFGTITG